MDKYNSVNGGGAGLRVPPQKPESSGTGALVGALIIVILLAFGAFYFWGATLNKTNSNPPPLILGNETASVEASDPASGLPAQQTSDDPAAISADLQAMDINQLSTQINNNLQSFSATAQ